MKKFGIITRDKEQMYYLYFVSDDFDTVLNACEDLRGKEHTF